MKPAVLHWYMRCYQLQVDQEDSVDEALVMAEGMADQGTAAFVCIEAWDESGYRLIDGDAFSAWCVARERDRRARPAAPAPRPPVATIYVKQPEATLRRQETSKEIAVESFWDMAEARASFMALAVLGDRARLEVE